MKFVYVDNRNRKFNETVREFNERVLAEIEASSVTEADKILKEQKGLDPLKEWWIGLQVLSN